MSEIIVTKKGLRLGSGKPQICVPVVASTAEEILSQIHALTSAGHTMIEWRADFFESIRDTDAVRAVIDAAEKDLAHCLFLFTIRSKSQGGQIELSEKELGDLQAIAASRPAVDFVDMEYLCFRRPEKQIRRIQKAGAYVIASHHDFQKTPEAVLLYKLAERMYLDGADIAKLAVMPQCRDDVLALLKLTSDLTENWPERLLITMSMGAKGCISRICGEVFGSCVTFGSVGTASAPGQIPADELSQVLDILHNSL